MNKFFLIIILSLIGAQSLHSQKKMTREEYVVKYYQMAIREMNLYKIPASITLAQGLLESENGNSRLAILANNHFGIKCQKVWTGPTISHDDDKLGECFRVYESADESYRDHSLFLTTRDRYKGLFDNELRDYKSWAYGLKEAGYATNPNYPQMLIKSIEELKLYEYDNYGVGTFDIMDSTALKLMKTDTAARRIIVGGSPKADTAKKKDTTQKATGKEPYTVKKPTKEEAANSLKFVVLGEDFNIEQLAKQNGLTRRELLIFNECEGEQDLKVGQNFYLERKALKAAVAIHEAKAGESIYDISQIYGVKADAIRKFNKIESWEQPQVGEAVFLNANRNSYMKTRSYFELQKERQKLYKAKILEEQAKTLDAPKIFVLNDTAKNEGVSNKDKVIKYTVKPKETIYSLAKKYGCKPIDIVNWNKLNADDPLKIGQELIINLK